WRGGKVLGGAGGSPGVGGRGDFGGLGWGLGGGGRWGGGGPPEGFPRMWGAAERPGGPPLFWGRALHAGGGGGATQGRGSGCGGDDQCEREGVGESHAWGGFRAARLGIRAAVLHRLGSAADCCAATGAQAPEVSVAD